MLPEQLLFLTIPASEIKQGEYGIVYVSVATATVVPVATFSVKCLFSLYRENRVGMWPKCNTDVARPLVVAMTLLHKLSFIATGCHV